MKQLRLVQKIVVCGYLGLVSMVSFGQNEPLPDLDCLIEPFRTIEVSSPINGIIKEFVVKKGDTIKRDDILLKLESSVELATVNLAKEKTKLDAEIRSKESLVSYTKKKQDRVDKLYRRKAISLSEKNDIEHDATQARYDLSKVRQNKRIAELELERAQKLLDKLTIKSPTDGVVMDLYLAAGESVKDKHIMKVAQIDPLRVEVIVPAEYFGRLEPGMVANIVPEIGANKGYKAKVQIVDKVIDAASGTFDVRLELSNKDYSIPAGVRCKISFNPVKGPAKTKALMKNKPQKLGERVKHKLGLS